MRQGDLIDVVATVPGRSWFTVLDRLIDAAIEFVERLVVGHIGRSFER